MHDSARVCGTAKLSIRRGKAAGLDLPTLLPAWESSLRAERKSARTINNYGNAVRAFIRWCEAGGHSPALDDDLVRAFVADLLDGGARPAAARSHHLGMRRFSAWLAEEGEIDDDPLARLET